MTLSPLAAAPTASRSPATSARPLSTAPRNRLQAFQLHLALWTLQAWLAMFFIGAAYAKMTRSHDLLTAMLGWPADTGLALVRATGGLELALAIGVIAPLASWRLQPVMSLAALGLFGLSSFNLALHLSRSDWGFAALNLILAAGAFAVLVGRLRTAADRR